jgi:predicted transcriptional regulator
MPKEGYKAVTIKEELYKQVNEIAERQDRSIASIVTQAIREFMETHKGEGS